MAIYKSGNPALNEKTFEGLAVGAEPMTLEGTAFKSLALLLLVIGSGAYAWSYTESNLELVGGSLLLASAIIGLVVAIITIFKKTWAPVTAPIYAVVEGFLLGAISYVYNVAFEGIVLQAILLTLGIFVSMLLLYLGRIIQPTENFKLGLAAATGGIALYYLASLILGFFSIEAPLISSTSSWGIGFTVLVIVIAALNLVVDFDFIEQGVEHRAPKYMEWYASFGLLVTLIWLYLEILRLLSKLRRR